jgi:hypothetical protein
MSENAPYILTEIWSARPEWLALPVVERERFFEQRVGPLLGGLIEQGAEILGCAINDNSGAERVDYRYMAVWKLPNKAFSDHLEAAAREAGFLDYFEQVNFSGSMIGPDQLNADMIGLKP